MTVFTQEQNDSILQWRIVIAIFELRSVHTREDTKPNLQFSIPEQGEAWVVFWHADWYFIWDRISIRNCMVYRRKWLKGHVAPPPKSQFRGQGIHTAISRRDLRDASLENTSGPSFELRNSNYAPRCKFGTHGPKYKWCITWMIIQIVHIALVWKHSM